MLASNYGSKGSGLSERRARALCRAHHCRIEPYWIKAAPLRSAAVEPDAFSLGARSSALARGAGGANAQVSSPSLRLPPENG